MDFDGKFSYLTIVNIISIVMTSTSKFSKISWSLLEKKQKDANDSFLSMIRDSLENSGTDLDAVLKFLENGFNLDRFESSPERWRQLFEVLIIGRPLGKV